MLQHHRPSAPMPERKQHAAMTALVLRVLETGDEIRDATETEDETRQRGPRTSAHGSRVSVLFFPFLFAHLCNSRYRELDGRGNARQKR